jgi:uncharacterized protein YbjT (DUF2867 family)
MFAKTVGRRLTGSTGGHELSRLSSMGAAGSPSSSLLFRVSASHYSIDTPPEELQANVPILSENIDMKNISLQVTGGRSSVSGIRATVFGASGTLGRTITNVLGRIGTQVVVPYRGDGREMARHKMMGDLGQIVPLPYQIRDKRSVERVIKGSNVVINCISARRETRNFSHHDTHVNATHMIARTAAELGVDRFIQVSIANCAPDSPSSYYRTKWHGEQVARAFYPEATIIRPSICYGFGDQWFDHMGFMWGLNFKYQKVVNGNQIIQPCHFLDAARAVQAAILDPETTAGKTYSIYGPVRSSKKRFFERAQEVLLCERTMHKCYKDWNPYVLAAMLKPFYPIHKRICHFYDFFRWYTPIQFLGYEDVNLTKVDMYPNYDVDPGLQTLEDIGIKPEDYFHWEAKCFEPYYDRFSRNIERVDFGRTNKCYGGPVPSTPWASMHSVSNNGYRDCKRLAFGIQDWWAFDASPENYVEWDRSGSGQVTFGSDIDGKSRIQDIEDQGKIGY